MDVQNQIKAGLDKMLRSEEINGYVHELMSKRLNSLTAIIADCGSVEEAVKTELLGLGMEPGYKNYGNVMIPLSRKEALTVFDEGAGAVFAVCPDGTEFELQTRAEIERDEYSFAMEIGHTISFCPGMEMNM